MRITSGFKKLIPSILGGAFGISLVIYGTEGDNPGIQLVGVIILVVSMVIMFRTRRRIACDIKPIKNISES